MKEKKIEVTNRQTKILTETKVLSEPVPTRKTKIQHKDPIEMHKVRGKGVMHFKKKLESRAVPQHPGGNGK